MAVVGKSVRVIERGAKPVLAVDDCVPSGCQGRDDGIAAAHKCRKSRFAQSVLNGLNGGLQFGQ